MTPDLLLVIDHRETTVRMNGRALRIDRPDCPPEQVPLGLLGLVVIHGSPLVGCEVWRELAERNIPAVLQPARGRGQCALIGAALGNTIALRIARDHGGEIIFTPRDGGGSIFELQLLLEGARS